MEYKNFDVPEEMMASDYLDILYEDGWIFVSLYCEKVVGSITKCKTVTVSEGQTVYQLIESIEDDGWTIIRFTMEK